MQDLLILGSETLNLDNTRVVLVSCNGLGWKSSSLQLRCIWTVLPSAALRLLTSEPFHCLMWWMNKWNWIQICVSMKTILPEHFGKGILPAFFVEHWILRSTHNRRCEKKTREKNADRWKKERNYAFIYQQMWTDLQRWTEQIIKSRKIIRKYWMNGNDAWVGGTNTYTHKLHCGSFYSIVVPEAKYFFFPECFQLHELWFL